MKISLGYYRVSDGSFIANETPTMDTCYYHVIATFRRKICEHPGSSPYKRHTVKQWQKTHCDENRLFIRLFEYRDRIKIQEITNHWHFYRPVNEEDRLEETRHKIYNSIFQNVVDKSVISLMEKYHITSRRYVYIPNGIEVNWGIIQLT
jgi:hypothetical protein